MSPRPHVAGVAPVHAVLELVEAVGLHHVVGEMAVHALLRRQGVGVAAPIGVLDVDPLAAGAGEVLVRIGGHAALVPEPELLARVVRVAEVVVLVGVAFTWP